MINSSTFHALIGLCSIAPILMSGHIFGADQDKAKESSEVMYKTIAIGGVDIFYREAGPADAPIVLLLHGFPTSSFMFRNLIPKLAGKYHVIAPDLPGFGQSSSSDPKTFPYTFDHLASILDQFTQELKLQKVTLYVQDYGAPVGYRIATAHPERISGIVSQNGNAYEDGLPAACWLPIKAYWADAKLRSSIDKAALTLEGYKQQTFFSARNWRRLCISSIGRNWQGSSRNVARSVCYLYSRLLL